MIKRNFWIKKILEAWKKYPIVWIFGIKEVGKTSLVKEFNEALYLNCDLPRVRSLLNNPEYFFKNLSHQQLIFDKIYSLPEPEKLIKTAFDFQNEIKMLITGTSNIVELKNIFSEKIINITLTPVLINECVDFQVSDIKKRLFYGGLPEILLLKERNEEFYSQWMDSFYARDVHELFRVDKRQKFLQMIELVLRESGNLLDNTYIAKQIKLSRPTVLNYIKVLEQTKAIYLLRPFHHSGKQEIVRQPKIYGFDTGFIAFYKGWSELREEDCGVLWKHLVLDFLLTEYNAEKIYYWRDKQQREVDFIYEQDNENIHIIECNWNPEDFEINGIKAFRSNYPNGKNYFISPKVLTTHERIYNNIQIIFTNIESFPTLFSFEKRLDKIQLDTNQMEFSLP